MNTEKLLLLADLLDEDADNEEGVQFDFSEWGRITDVTKALSCGTAACAMGLAAISGKFEGLTYGVDGGLIQFKLDGEVMSGGRAGAAVFDIEREDAGYLFSAIPLPNGGRGAEAERTLAKYYRRYVELGGDGAALRAEINEAEDAKWRAAAELAAQADNPRTTSE